MKKGFELLKSDVFTGKKIAKIEEVLGTNLPDTFKYFCEMFMLGQECFQNAKRSFGNILLPITSVEYIDSNADLRLRISHFYELQELKDKWPEDVQFNDWYKKKKLLSIAYEEINLGQVFLCVSQDNFGSIWYIDGYEGSVPVLLAANVLEFVSRLIETEINDEDFKSQQVYQNWGESFWRIHEDE